MNVVALAVLVAVAVLIVMAVLSRRRILARTPVCDVNQIPAVFEQLKQKGGDGSFAVFIFQPSGQLAAGDAIHIQFSIENGRLGLDWCLIGPANIRDQAIFEQFVSEAGQQIVRCEMNGVKYLRVEGDDLPQLCRTIIRDGYHKGLDARLDMVVEGFAWP